MTMRYSDRSRRELGWTCLRARFHGYEVDGIGLTPLETPKELQFGGAMADQIAEIKRGNAPTLDAFATADRPLAHALLTGYRDVVWPRWLQSYEVLAIEQEFPILLTPWLTYNSRPDTVMQRIVDRSIWYAPEDKTTAWVDSLLGYAQSIQLHATGLCIEKYPGKDGQPIRIAGCIVQGMNKGFEKEGKFYHPLVYAYRKEGRAGIVPDQWDIKWTRNWERTAVAEYPGGVAAFLKKLKPEQLSDIFPCSEPVVLNRPLAESYLAQTVQAESRIEEWRQGGSKTDDATLNVYFPQSFSQCDAFGKSRKPCVFKEACFNQTAKRFPLTFYRHRQPHHPNEKDALCSK